VLETVVGQADEPEAEGEGAIPAAVDDPVEVRRLEPFEGSKAARRIQLSERTEVTTGHRIDRQEAATRSLLGYGVIAGPI
jgi:hypothetical protein